MKRSPMPPRTKPLVTRVPLLRKTSIARRAERRADPALPNSGRKTKLGTSIPLRVRRAVKARSEGNCEVCLMSGADHMHHRLMRSQGGEHTVENLLHVHWGCHEDIHLNPARSYELGHLVRRGADPAQIPVTPLPKIRSL